MNDDAPDLTYNGTSYRLAPDVATDLLRRGVIVASEAGETRYELSIEHTIEEIEPVAEVVARSDAPRRSRLRVSSRHGGLEPAMHGTGFWQPRKIYVERDEDRRD
jgi:hypothetical protein